ncbi:MAG: PorT family protein [Bacteroidales bacterium]|nr:PorT family protein [Bacteroidales bacterium]
MTILAFATMDVNGQKNNFSQLLFGVNQGITASQLDFGVTVNQSLYLGYQGGLFLTYLSGPGIGVQLECNYAQKGWKIQPDSTESYSRRLNYIEIPFMTHVIFGKQKSKLVIDLGPYVSFLHSEKETSNIADSSLDYIGHFTDRNFEFGYCVGIGYQYNTKAGNFGFHVRYNNSLTNIFTPSAELQYFASRNQSLGISIKYSIKIF